MGAVVVALSLSLLAVAPAVAAPDWAPGPHHGGDEGAAGPALIRGEVISVDESAPSFVVQASSTEVTVTVDDNTRYACITFTGVGPGLSAGPLEMPGLAELNRLGLMSRFHVMTQGMLMSGTFPALVQNRVELGAQIGQDEDMGSRFCRFDSEAAFSDITVGSEVIVWGSTQDEIVLAERVMIINQLINSLVEGTVTEVNDSAKTITIAPADGGAEVILSYDDDTRILLLGSVSLETGVTVRAVADETGLASLITVVPEPAP
jgi:hypothetical protein